MPPVTARTPSTIRKITGSTSQYRPSPPHTPATTFCRGLRCSRGAGSAGRRDAGGGVLGNGHGSMVTARTPSWDPRRPWPIPDIAPPGPSGPGPAASPRVQPPRPGPPGPASSGTSPGPTLMPRPARTCDDRCMPAPRRRAPSPHAPDPEEPPPRKLYRSADGRMLGGVARGLAGHLGLPVSWVRIVFLGAVHARTAWAPCCTPRSGSSCRWASAGSTHRARAPLFETAPRRPRAGSASPTRARSSR